MKRHGYAWSALLCFALILAVAPGCDTPPPANSLPTAATATAGTPAEILYCHWNVENLFDDQNDGRTGPGDREYDRWYAEHPEIVNLKLAKLTAAILKMNAGRGPDILSIVEVESLRAAELLQQALNRQLTDPRLHYQNILMKEVAAGRHIAPAILTRLPVVRDRTRLLGKRQRILESRVIVNGHELTIIASHWTSRLQDGKKGRADYADKIYGECHAMFRSNPDADFLVSGDFNDDPDDDSVAKHLHGTADLQAVRIGNPFCLLNLLANKDPRAFGTHYYRGWHSFDQILVSPGMIDSKAWSCDPASIHVVNDLHRAKDKLQRPWRFGSEHEKSVRGYSDHFPVTVRLRVQ